MKVKSLNMMLKTPKILIWGMLLWFIPAFTQAAPAIVLEETWNQSASMGSPLGLYLDILEDKEGRLSIEEILSDEVSQRFVPSQSEVPNYGFTDSVYWARFQLSNPLTVEQEWILEVWQVVLDLELYIVHSDNRYIRKQAGRVYPFAQRDIPYHNITFRHTIAPGEDYTIYLRNRTRSIRFPLTLWSTELFWENSQKASFELGVIYGIMVIMALYHFFVFTAVRDKSYLFYVLYIVFALLANLSATGMGFQYLWPEWPWWELRARPIFLGFSAILALLFSRSFLNTKEYTPVFHKIMNWLIGVFVLQILMVFMNLTLAYKMLIGFGIVWITILIAAGLASLKGGFQSARYFLLGWLVLLGFILVGLLEPLGLHTNTFLMTYGYSISWVLLFVLLSLALADRINILKKEKALAQEQALEFQRVLNEELEKKVNQRTEALNSSLKKIKQTQSQLVQSEKMASLGTMVAGVAHEINNPTSYVYATTHNLKNNISELKQLIFDLAGDNADEKFIQMFEKRFERLGRNLSNIAEGSNRIKGIVQDLRVFSRLDEAERKPMHVVDGIRSTLRLIQTQYKKEVEFIEDFQVSPEIMCWPAELNQVYMNVIVNACQAIVAKQKQTGEQTPGKLWIRTFFEGEAGNQQVGIQFEDTGCGMSQEVQGQIFDPFFTTKEIGQGTGLGMSISYGIIKKHKGMITVHSQKDKGSTITLLLPTS